MTDFEPEVFNAWRCFVDAQAWLLTATAGPVAVTTNVTIGWYDTDVDPNKGSFALVSATGAFADNVGDILRITTTDLRTCFVYVFGTAALQVDLALAFRSWVSLTLPSEDSLVVRVEVMART